MLDSGLPVIMENGAFAIVGNGDFAPMGNGIPTVQDQWNLAIKKGRKIFNKEVVC